MSNKWVAALAGFCLCCILLLCLAVSREPSRPCVCAEKTYWAVVETSKNGEVYKRVTNGDIGAMKDADTISIRCEPFIPAVQPPVGPKRLWYDGMFPKSSTPGGRE